MLVLDKLYIFLHWLYIIRYLGIQLTDIKKFLQQNPRRTWPTANASQPGLTTTEAQSHVYTATIGTNYRKWDADANTFVLSEHNAGKAADEITKQLIGQGYAVARAEVVGSLYRQGVPNARLGPMPADKHLWNALADIFTLAGFNAKKSVSEILAGLTDQGYNVSEAEVRASLIKQGKLLYN